MRSNLTSSGSSIRCSVVLLIVALFCTVATAAPLLSRAQPTTSIRVVNNSQWVIHHIYLSSPNDDNWGADQLNDGLLSTGQETTISASCDGSQIKVVTEDADGCFLSTVVSCSANAEWTITNDATPNCGGQ